MVEVEFPYEPNELGEGDKYPTALSGEVEELSIDVFGFESPSSLLPALKAESTDVSHVVLFGELALFGFSLDFSTRLINVLKYISAQVQVELSSQTSTIFLNRYGNIRYML